MNGFYLNDFEDFDDVMCEYSVKDEDKNFIKQIILADYTYEDYSGDSYVLFVGVDGKLYEVYGSHCSCYGLEDQWDYEETSLDVLYDQIERGVIHIGGIQITDIINLIKLTIK